MKNKKKLNKVEDEVIEVTEESNVEFAVTEEDDVVHVRPVVDGEILDTPVEEVIEPEDVSVEPLQAKPVYGTVTGAKKLNLRLEPSMDAEVIHVLSEGDVVKFESIFVKNEFIQVSFTLGVTTVIGYCKAEFIKAEI